MAEKYSILHIYLILFIHLLLGTWVFNLILYIMKNVAMNMDVLILVWIPAFSSFGYKTRSEVAGS